MSQCSKKSWEIISILISSDFLIEQNRLIPFLSKTVSQHLTTWFLIAERQEVKSIGNSVVAHELECAIKRDL